MPEKKPAKRASMLTGITSPLLRAICMIARSATKETPSRIPNEA